MADVPGARAPDADEFRPAIEDVTQVAAPVLAGFSVTLVALLVTEHEHLYAFTRTLDDVRLTVVANLSDRDGLVPSAEGVPVEGEVVLTNKSYGVAPDTPLGPWAARVVRGPR